MILSGCQGQQLLLIIEAEGGICPRRTWGTPILSLSLSFSTPVFAFSLLWPHSHYKTAPFISVWQLLGKSPRRIHTMFFNKKNLFNFLSPTFQKNSVNKSSAPFYTIYSIQPCIHPVNHLEIKRMFKESLFPKGMFWSDCIGTLKKLRTRLNDVRVCALWDES